MKSKEKYWGERSSQSEAAADSVLGAHEERQRRERTEPVPIAKER